MTFHEQLENYFNSILGFNWGKFNELDTQKQSSDWKSLLGEFDSIIRKELQENSLNYEFVYDLIYIYRERFEKLPIESLLYTKINKHFISGKFYGFIRNLEFEEAHKKSNAICSCELLHKFSKYPSSENLKEIKVLYDGYYNPILLECLTCHFQWISYTADDSTGETVFEKYVK